VTWDVLYIHPAKQEVVTRYDEYIASPPHLFMPVGVIGLANLLREQGLRVKGLNLPLELILKPAFDAKPWLQAHRPLKLVDDPPALVRALFRSPGRGTAVQRGASRGTRAARWHHGLDFRR
jgi:hypothetical protein